MAVLSLFKSKTNYWRDAVDVVHPISPNEACASRYLQRIIDARPGKDPTQPLFQDRHGGPILRKRFTEWMTTNLKAVGIENPLYKGHSLRIGGATELAEMGVQDHLIQALGRWRSSCYQLYKRTNNFEKLATCLMMYERSKDPL
jgi:site-specific recombinase XerD